MIPSDYNRTKAEYIVGGIAVLLFLGILALPLFAR